MYILYYIVNQDVRQSYKRIKLSNFSVKNIKIRNTRFDLTSERYTFQQPLIITQSTIPHIFIIQFLTLRLDLFSQLFSME